MKFSEKWLYEWVKPNISTEELISQFDMSGLEVDSYGPVAKDFSGVFVGEVIDVKKHPNADKLSLCQVNVGQDEILDVVCGASNVSSGLKVALAKVGARLSDKFKIKRSKIRGEESNGMICSSSELGLEEVSEGIMELPSSAPIGVDLREYMQLDDNAIDVDLTPNRGDCLSVYGVAREVAAINKSNLTIPFESHVITPSCDEMFPVVIEAKEDCPHYVGRVIKDIDPNAKTPLWLKERLRRSGIRSIAPVVDVTNYVLLECGQPMHAFDLNQLVGKIIVRKAKHGENIVLLNGQFVELDEETLVIADENHSHAIAGVMGGGYSAVNDGTRDIFLESAFFAPAKLAGKARRYGLQTDSSMRFERGVDPHLQVNAIERATELLLSIVGGRACPIVEVLEEDFLPKCSDIFLPRTKIKRLLGISLEDDVVEGLLKWLNMGVVQAKDGWNVSVPSYRFDVSRDVDLIEEIARLHGYNRIPNSYQSIPMTSNLPLETTVGLREIRSCLVSRGYQEAYTYNFVDPELQALLDPEHEPLELVNPIAKEMSVMRTTLWPGLINTLLYNQHRQQNRVRLFEIGRRYVPKKGDVRQETVISGVVSGSVLPEQWGIPERSTDFFDVKSDIEALLHLTALQKCFIFKGVEHPALHPGQTGSLSIDGNNIGIIGALHPRIEKELGCIGPVYLFELCLEGIDGRILPTFEPISRFPSIRRDLALVVDKDIPSAEVQALIEIMAGCLLKECLIFDVYSGKGIEVGKKSIAIALTLQCQDKTLTDEQSDELIDRVIYVTQKELKATVRT